MIYPDYKTFRKLTDKGNLIPVYTELMADLETPLSAYLKVAAEPYSFLLESVEGGERWARYSFISSNPSSIFYAKKDSAYLIKNNKKVIEDTSKDYLKLLEEIMKEYKPAPVESLPDFIGGAVGFIAYDWIKRYENIPDRHPDKFDMPEAIFMITDNCIVFDNLRHKIILISTARTGEESTQKTYNRAVSKVEALVKSLKKPLMIKTRKRNTFKIPSFISNFKKEEFTDIVRKAKKYVEDGEIIQVVLSQRFETRAVVDALDVYRALRLINPSPYMYYLNFDEVKIAGSSPELLVKLNGREMALRPIAGTRPRSSKPEEDQKLAEELLSDPKERAEHIMLVDLGRNDLGRVATPGSVRLQELMHIEKYSHVMHLVSTITATLKDDKNSFDLLRSAFPAGTVTGAPKIRAMQIIDELEKTRRGPYAGAVGYFGFNGYMDMAINLRTAIFTRGRIYIQAGAGIVYDSFEEKEYLETINKAKAIMKAVEIANKGFKI